MLEKKYCAKKYIELKEVWCYKRYWHKKKYGAIKDCIVLRKKCGDKVWC